jgi:hypothetical protein
VLGLAAKLAKSPQESQAVDNLLMNAQEYAEGQEQNAAQNRPMSEESTAALPSEVSAEADIPQLVRRKEFVASGPHHFVFGVLKAVHCDEPTLDLTVSFGAKTLILHADNFYKIQFSALNFQPSGDLKPCSDLENRPAKVEYVESADKSDPPRLIAIELHK